MPPASSSTAATSPSLKVQMTWCNGGGSGSPIDSSVLMTSVPEFEDVMK